HLLAHFAPAHSEVAGLAQRTVSLVANILVTQILVSLGWIFFWAPSLSDAVTFFRQLFAPGYSIPETFWLTVFPPLTLLFVIDFLQARAKNVSVYWTLHPLWRAAIFVFIVLAIFTFAGATRAVFVYAGF